MATREPATQKTAADLNRWQSQMGQRLKESTELIVHGGTALTLRGVKESTTDVDFGVRDRADFRRFGRLLQQSGYEQRRDFRPRPTEVYQRWRNPAEVVDVVDIRHPTWNGWIITERILKGARILRLGNARLVLPDVNTVLLFKTYPLRDTDLSDLKDTLERASVNEGEVIELFDEQDGLYRMQFWNEEIEYEPVLNVVEMRVRLAASLQLLGESSTRAIPTLRNHAQEKFQELDLEQPIGELAALIRSEETVVNWDSLLGNSIEKIREKLAV